MPNPDKMKQSAKLKIKAVIGTFPKELRDLFTTKAEKKRTRKERLKKLGIYLNDPT